MTKVKLKEEIAHLNAEIFNLRTWYKKHECQESELVTKQNEVSALRKKLQDMKNAIAAYENIFNLMNDWDKMTYNVTSIKYDLINASTLSHLSIEFDVVPAPIPEDYKNEKE